MPAFKDQLSEKEILDLTNTENFLGSDSPQLASEYNRNYSYNPIPRQLCCGSLHRNKDRMKIKTM